MSSQANSPPRQSGTLESALYARDLVAAADFWTRIMGLRQVAFVPGRHVFFHTGAGMLLIFNPDATSQPPPKGARLPVPPHGSLGPGHFCLAVAPMDLAAWRAHLIRHAVVIEAELEWPQGGRSIYFRDPAGNSIELADPQIWADAISKAD